MRTILLCVLTFVLALPASAQHTDLPHSTNRFGIIEGFWMPELACDLQVGWERIIFDWAQHQPNSADEWHTLNVDDRWLKSASQCDREVVALLKNTPQWATDGTVGVGVPRGLDLPIDSPDNLWANFVQKTVDYYASRGVNHFIIWNEPDISSGTYGYEFEGKLDDYFMMLKVAYQVAKSTNPSAMIHLAGTTYWHDVNEGRTPYMERLVDRILDDPDAKENNFYFDVLSLHIYFRTETMTEIVGIMRDMLDSRGLTQQAIWINETNAAPTDDPEWQVARPVFQLDLEQQGAYIVQASALALASGVERLAVYKLFDQALSSGAESFGITVPSTGLPRPAYYAYQMVVEQFASVTSATLYQTKTVSIVQMQVADSHVLTVMWARQESPVSLKIIATSDKAYHLDQYGNMTLIRPVDETYGLDLAPARCTETDGCFIGGAVSILIQPVGTMTITQIEPNQTIILEK
jgi:hypothetical protein